MSLKIAIIADDLTGALDTGTPFVQAGLTVRVAVDAAATAEALAAGPDVLVVNLASRALSPQAAAERMREVAELLREAEPAILLKKIDSRLKGNAGAESAALAKVFGRAGLVVAPAVPDQGRLTENGHVVGRGVDQPLPIAPVFSGFGIDVDVGDAAHDDHLDRLVQTHDWAEQVAVGARGLGSAFARHLADNIECDVAFTSTPETLFAFGSRDPITMAQMDALGAGGLLRHVVEAPHGRVPEDVVFSLPALLRCAGDLAEDAETVARRFAIGVKSVVETSRPAMLMMGGGDTALAILQALGARVLVPSGEIEAGVPWFEVTLADGRAMRCAVKSGGFGGPRSLLRLIPEIAVE
jgi:uncharacterized protein YgbK (DUF1537 family)